MASHRRPAPVGASLRTLYSSPPVTSKGPPDKVGHQPVRMQLTEGINVGCDPCWCVDEAAAEAGEEQVSAELPYVLLLWRCGEDLLCREGHGQPAYEGRATEQCGLTPTPSRPARLFHWSRHTLGNLSNPCQRRQSINQSCMPT